MNTNRNKYFFAFTLIIILFFTSCSKDDPEVIAKAVITNLSDDYGMRGSELTISGSDFHSSAIVYFDGIATTPLSIEPGSIVVTVPDDAKTAVISIMQGGARTEGPSYHVYTRAKNIFFTQLQAQTVNKIDLINDPNVNITLYDRSDGILGPIGIDMADDGILYVTDYMVDKVLKMPNDGSGNVDMLYNSSDGVYAPSGIAIDYENNTLYWYNIATYSIMKASMDGTVKPSELFDNKFSPYTTGYGLKLSLENREIYMSDYYQYIKKGKMDGSGTLNVLFNPDNSPGMSNPSNIFIDPVRGKLYWTDVTAKQIVEANMDSSGIPIILFDETDGLEEPAGISVDYASGKLYWSDISLNKIFSGNLDGTGTPDELSDAPHVYGMTLEFEE